MTTSGRTVNLSTMILGMIIGLGTCLAAGSPAAHAAENPRVELDTSEGKIVLELDSQKAPVTVENFLKYVDDHFYDGLIFHRVISGFMIQGGGFTDKLQQKDESEGVRQPIKNESGNGLSNKRGTIAMARTSNPNSATCQFFINHADNDNLDTYGGGYAVFGKVVEGMDVVDAIAKTDVAIRGGLENVPTKPIYIKTAKRIAK